MSDKRKIYVHTLRGKPAVFANPNLVYASRHNRLPAATSLRQIRSEQAKDMHYRAKHLLPYEHDDYGYVIVWLPKGDSK